MPCFLVTHGRQETCGSDTKDLVTYNNGSSQSSSICVSSTSCSSQRVTWRTSGDARQWLVVQKNLGFQESKSFITGTKPAWFFAWERHSLYFTGQYTNLPFFQKEILSLLCNCVNYRNIPEESLEWRLCCLFSFRNMRGPWRIVSPFVYFSIWTWGSVCLTTKASFLLRILLNSKLSEGEWKILCC